MLNIHPHVEQQKGIYSVFIKISNNTNLGRLKAFKNKVIASYQKRIKKNKKKKV